MLHMYLLSTRFRAFPADLSPHWQQHLLDHFFYDAEVKMEIEHGMVARGTRNKNLKELLLQWRGCLLAYDEGLVRGDAALAAAVWRNVFKADANVDVQHLAMIVSWMRGSLQDLDGVSDHDAMTKGTTFAFGNPDVEEQVVRERSKMMDLPFERAEGKDLPGKVAPVQKR